MTKEKPVNHTELDKAPLRNAPVDPAEYFKTVSPIQLLQEIGDGLVSDVDLKTVERLIDEVGMDPGVVNVLLAYIAKTKDGILPTYNYFEKVGHTWIRNHINTVEMAMNYIKHLETRRTSKGNTYQYTNKPKDVEVDWLDEYIKNLE